MKYGEVVRTSPISGTLIKIIEEINSYYPAEIVKYYSPENMELPANVNKDPVPVPEPETIQGGEEEPNLNPEEA